MGIEDTCNLDKVSVGLGIEEAVDDGRLLIIGIEVPGYVTTLCAVLFMGGIIEMSVGILGEYIGRIYIEAKGRPIYIAKESNLED